MMQKPTFEWLYTGSWPFSVFGILPADIETSRATRYAGFKFQGPGWYPKHRILLEETGETREGKMTYRVTHWDNDPRDSFRAAGNLPAIE